MVGHVFISYAHDDRDYCNELDQAIRRHGLETWYDKGLRLGEHWHAALEEQIATCAAFVLIISRHAAKKGSFVRDEFVHAHKRGKRIFSVRLDKTAFLQVDVIQGVDAFDRSVPDESWFAKLRSAVREFLEASLSPSLVRSFGKNDGLRIAAWSPDARLIAAVGQTGRAILSSADGVPVSVLGEGTDLDGTAAEALAAWSPNGKHLLTGANDGSLLVWTLAREGATVTRVPPAHTGEGRVRVAAWSPDSTRIAFVGRYGGARVISPGQLGEGTALTNYQGRISALAWSRDGRSITTGHNDGRIWQFDERSGQSVRDPVSGHGDRGTQRINCMAWSPVANLLASGGDDGAVMIWDWDASVVGSEPARRHVGSHKAGIWGMSWSPDGKYLATAGGDDRVCVWELASGLQFSVPHPHQVWSVSWSTDNRLVTTSGDGEAHIWSLWSMREGEAA